MDISNEIKAKIFSQYLSYFIGTPGSLALLTIISNLIEGKFSNYRLSGLKPLSAISDEDALEVANIFECDSPHVYHRDSGRIMVYSVNINFSIWHDGEILPEDNNIGGDNIPVLLFAYQFLQSKGYDLPQSLLKGKTLKECNLATYE